MVNIIIDISKCDKCLECVENCPSDALKYDDMFQHDSAKCTYCESCLDVCMCDCIEFEEEVF